jgi:hypothetical protein
MPVGASSSPHVRYYGTLYGIPIVAVSPRYTTQDCSGCGERVKKTLSMGTHICPHCGLVVDRDWNAALNIRAAALAGAAPSVPPGRWERVPFRRNKSLQDRPPRRAVFARARRKRAG